MGDFILDHPILCFLMISISVIAIFILSLLLFYKVTSGTYEYVDLDNNVGYAENCFVEEGHNVCYLKDGGVISVKQYKKID